MTGTETTMAEQRFFEDVQPGTELVAREYDPLSIIDTVRWAGLQENTQQLHYDRDWVREHAGLRTFIASGAYRQALLMRMLTDWLGPRGRLRKLGIRHTYSTFEGDTMRFAARAAEKSADPADPWIRCEVEGTNQEGRRILTGQCTLLLPCRD